MKYIIQLEKRIAQKTNDIKSGIITPSESKVGILLNALKGLDEVSYDKHIAKYKEVLNDIKK